MPLPIQLAHPLARAAGRGPQGRASLDYLRPDGKTQVTVRYENGRPVEIDTVADLDPARRERRRRGR